MTGGPGGPGGGPGGPGSAEILAWVREHGKLVDSKLWQPESTGGAAVGRAGPSDRAQSFDDGPGGRTQPTAGRSDNSALQGARRATADASAMGRRLGAGRMGGMRQLYDLRPELGLVAPPASLASTKDSRGEAAE